MCLCSICCHISCHVASGTLRCLYFREKKSGKWQITIFSIITKIVLTLETPWKCSKGPQGTMDPTLRTAALELTLCLWPWLLSTGDVASMNEEQNFPFCFILINSNFKPKQDEFFLLLLNIIFLFG